MPDLAKFNLFFLETFGKAQEAGYIKIAAIFLGVFVVFSLLALARKYLFKVSMHGVSLGLVLGIILMIILDLIIIIGLSDKEALGQLKKGEKRKEATQKILVSGFSNLGKVLGLSVAPSSRKPQNAQEVLNQLFVLPKEEIDKVKDFICQ